MRACACVCLYVCACMCVCVSVVTLAGRHSTSYRHPIVQEGATRNDVSALHFPPIQIDCVWMSACPGLRPMTSPEAYNMAVWSLL